MFTDYVLSKQQEIEKYLKNIGIDPKNIQDTSLMLTAFIHKSYAMDFTQDIAHNERLEFLGDAVLGGIIASQLYTQFPDYDESQLTLYKIALIREETLASVAKDIKLQKIIFISNGEEKMKGRQKPSVLSDCLEALIGFIYIDAGYDTTYSFINKYIYSKIHKIEDLIPVKSYKSRVQELIQKKYKTLPQYKDSGFEVQQSGNITTFKSQLMVNDQIIATGFGSSKKKAHEDAAKKFLEKKK